MHTIAVPEKILHRYANAGEVLIVSILPNGTKGLINRRDPNTQVILASGSADLVCMGPSARKLFRIFSESVHVIVEDQGETFIGNGVSVGFFQLPVGQYVEVCGQEDEQGVGVRIPQPLPSLVMAVAAAA